MVARNVTRVSLVHVSLFVTENVPYAEPSAALVPRALDLIGGGRASPDKILFEAHISF